MARITARPRASDVMKFGSPSAASTTGGAAAILFPRAVDFAGVVCDLLAMRVPEFGGSGAKYSEWAINAQRNVDRP